LPADVVFVSDSERQGDRVDRRQDGASEATVAGSGDASRRGRAPHLRPAHRRLARQYHAVPARAT